MLQARAESPAAAVPVPGQAPLEAGLLTVTSRDQCKVKEIESESERPGGAGGVQRMVFASNGTELLGALDSGATFLWSRIRSAARVLKPTGALPLPAVPPVSLQGSGRAENWPGLS